MVFGGGISASGGSGHSLQSGTVGELGADLDNLDEVVADVAVEAHAVPRRAGAVANNAGEARRLPLRVFRARADQYPIEAALVQLCDVGHGNSPLMLTTDLLG